MAHTSYEKITVTVRVPNTDEIGDKWYMIAYINYFDNRGRCKQ